MNRQGPIKFPFSTLLMSFTYSLKRVTIRQKNIILSIHQTISFWVLNTLFLSILFVHWSLWWKLWCIKCTKSLFSLNIYNFPMIISSFFFFFLIFWFLLHIQPLCKPLVIIQNLFLISSDNTIQRKICFTLLAWLIQDLNFFFLFRLNFVLWKVWG